MYAHAIMGIQAIKGVEVGLGFEMARRPGSDVMDEIFRGEQGYYRETNHSGGIEGGMSTGMPILVRAAMKPIPTLRRPLRSVNIRTHETEEAGALGGSSQAVAPATDGKIARFRGGEACSPDSSTPSSIEISSADRSGRP